MRTQSRSMRRSVEAMARAIEVTMRGCSPRAARAAASALGASRIFARGERRPRGDVSASARAIHSSR